MLPATWVQLFRLGRVTGGLRDASGALGTVIPPYPPGTRSQTPSGCPKLWIVPKPMHTVSLPAHTYTLWLLFGVFESPASLLLHLGALLSKIRVI